MLTAQNKHRVRFDASDVKDRTDPRVWDNEFQCPYCENPVILKMGQIKSYHFAHMAGGDCGYSREETAAHRKAKNRIFTIASQYAKDKPELSVHKEYITSHDGHKQIIDVAIVKDGQPIAAFELQHSN